MAYVNLSPDLRIHLAEEQLPEGISLRYDITNKYNTPREKDFSASLSNADKNKAVHDKWNVLFAD